MKKHEILFIIWMCFTILLTFSVIGMLLFYPKDTFLIKGTSTRSTWMQLGLDLFDRTKL